MTSTWRILIGVLLFVWHVPGAVDATAYELSVSTAANRTNPTALQGATVSGNIYVFVTPGSGATQVRFFLDNPTTTGTPRQVENNPPYDFAGGTVDLANPFNTTQVGDGSHTITAAISLSGGGTDVVTASFTVANGGATPGPPDQVHLAWVDDPATTLTVVWRTLDVSTPSAIEYRVVGAGSWHSALGAPRPSGTSGTLHEVTLGQLTPATDYEYRVLGDGGTWSPIFATRTAPPPGPADFTAVYVADTGLIGRLDGLATGTEQVVEEIAALQPTLVLPGGDYIYYDTDRRFGTLDDTIDVWFNQMQPMAAHAPLMPTYGNHEVLLGEGFAPWAARFPTPAGFDGRRHYSFDIGDVHFVSIMAVENFTGLPASVLQWIEQDIVAAQAAGQRWIIPYFHVSPFADGTNHSSNLQLRAQLGPLFERLGVKLVLASHDQAYERSFPLIDVPSTNTPTSSSLTCYTMGDGVTWVKISPGGKLSNINKGFSQFATNPPPAWTAVRSNTYHHFARLIVSAAGSIRLDTYGVVGDGSPPVIVDSFRYTTGACPAQLQFDPPSVSMTASSGGTTTAQVDLEATSGTASYTVSDSAPWLTVSPGTATTPRTLTLTADASGLAAGTHSATVTATAPGYTGDTLQVTLTVGGGGSGHAIVWSTQANRTSPMVLDGANVAGSIYVFLTPEAGVTRVRFYLDGVLRQTENLAPFDFAGTAPNGTAQGFNTAGLSDGLHDITAEVDLTSGGTTLLTSQFTVANNSPALLFNPESVTLNVAQGGSTTTQVTLADNVAAAAASYTVSDTAPWLTVSPGSGTTPATLTLTADASGLAAGTHTATVTATAPGYTGDTLQVTLSVGGGGGTYALVWSAQANRASPTALAGAQVSGNIYAFVTPGTGVTRVRFYLDDPNMTGTPRQVENTAPHDFAGGSVPTANPFPTGSVSNGSHTITAAVELSTGGTQVVHATFTVANP